MTTNNEVINEAALSVIKCEAEVNENIKKQNELREQKQMLIDKLQSTHEKLDDFISQNAKLLFNADLRNSFDSSLNNTRKLGEDIYVILEDAHADFDNSEHQIQSNMQLTNQHKNTLTESVKKLTSQIDKENVIMKQHNTANIQKKNTVHQEEQTILHENIQLHEELNKIMKESQRMLEENDELKSQLLFEEGELIKKIKMKEDENTNILLKCEDLDKELLGFRSENIVCLKAIQQRITENEEEQNSLNKSFQQLQQELEIILQQISGNQSKEITLMEEIETFKTNTENINRNINNLKSNLESEISATTHKVQEIQVFTESTSKKAESLTKEKGNITDLILQVKKEIDDIINNTTTIEINDLETSIGDLKNGYEKCVSDFEIVNNEIPTYEKEANQKENQLQELLRKIEDRETTYSNQSQTIQNQYNNEITMLEKEILENENEIKAKQASVDDTDVELNQQKIEYEETLNKPTNFKRDIEKIDVEINNVSIEHKKICEQIKAFYNKPVAKEGFVKPMAAKPNKRHWDSDSSIEDPETYSQFCIKKQQHKIGEE